MDFYDRTVSVKNLHEDVTKDLLEELFIQIGPIHLVTMHGERPNASSSHLNNQAKANITKKQANHSKELKTSSYAYVEFLHEESVIFACEMLNNLKLFGRPIKVAPNSKYQIFKMIEEKERAKKLQKEQEKLRKREKKRQQREETHEEKIKRKQEKKEKKEEIAAKKKQLKEARTILRLSNENVENKSLAYTREEMFQINSELDIKTWVTYCIEAFNIRESEVLKSLSKHKKEDWYNNILMTPKISKEKVISIQVKKQEKVPKIINRCDVLKTLFTESLLEEFKNKLNDLSSQACSCTNMTSLPPNQKLPCETCQLFGSLALMTLHSWEAHVSSPAKSSKISQPHSKAIDTPESIDKGYLAVSLPPNKESASIQTTSETQKTASPKPYQEKIHPNKKNSRRLAKTNTVMQKKENDKTSAEKFQKLNLAKTKLMVPENEKEPDALVHANESTQKDPKLKKKRYPLGEEDIYLCCDICSMEFNNVKQFRKHTSSHSNPIPKRMLQNKNDQVHAGSSSDKMNNEKIRDEKNKDLNEVIPNGSEKVRRIQGGIFRRGIRIISASKKK